MQLLDHLRPDSTLLLPAHGHAGKSKLVLTCADGRPFLVAVQLCRKRSMDQVIAMMKPQLELSQAIQRVKDQVCKGSVRFITPWSIGRCAIPGLLHNADRRHGLNRVASEVDRMFVLRCREGFCLIFGALLNPTVAASRG